MSADYERGFDDGFKEATDGWGYGHTLRLTPDEWEQLREKAARAAFADALARHKWPQAIITEWDDFTDGAKDAWKSWADAAMTALGYEKVGDHG